MSTDPYAVDKRRVRLSFERAAAEYDAHAVLQREVCTRLLERLDLVKLDPAGMLDLGSGTGQGARALHMRYPCAELVVADISVAMLRIAREHARGSPLAKLRSLILPRAPRPPRFVCLDAEHIALASGRLDLVWSSLALQWVNDLAATIGGVQRVLRPGGLFMFSTFGPDTLRELRTAFATLDDAPHVNRFTDMHDIGDMLVHAGFTAPVMEMEKITLTYADLKALMRDLKGLGAHNAAVGRRAGMLGRGRWAALSAAYERHRRDGRLPATFEVIYGHAWAGARRVLEDGRQVIEMQIAQRKARVR